MSSHNDDQVKMKFIVLGEPGAGKTSLCQRLGGHEGKLPDPCTTIGMDFQLRDIRNLSEEQRLLLGGSELLKLQIWDSSGSPPCYGSRPNWLRVLLRHMNAILLCYDINDALSFTRLQQFWVPEVQGFLTSLPSRSDAEKVCVCIVGLKRDQNSSLVQPRGWVKNLSRQVESSEGVDLLESLGRNGILFTEVSSADELSQGGVEELFAAVIQEMIVRHDVAEGVTGRGVTADYQSQKVLLGTGRSRLGGVRLPPSSCGQLLPRGCISPSSGNTQRRGTAHREQGLGDSAASSSSSPSSSSPNSTTTEVSSSNSTWRGWAGSWFSALNPFLKK